MPVKSDATMTDGHHNLSTPTEPEEPDSRLHAAWLGQVSTAADGVLERVPKQIGGSASDSTSCLAPGDRVLTQGVRLALPSRSGFIIMASIGFIFAAVVAAMVSLSVTPFGSWHPPAGGGAVDQPTSSEPLTSATSEIANEPGTPKLIAEPSVGVPGEPAQMRLAVRGPAHDAVVIVRGLVPGMELSAGTAIASDRWELTATDLPYAWIAPPRDFVGSTELIAELRLPNAQIADRQIVHVEWTRTATGPEYRPEREQISGQKEVDPAPPIAPATVQHSHNRDLVTAVPPMSAEPAHGQLGRKEGKSARAREKPSLRRSDGRGAPLASSDNTRIFKGFWDWSR